MVVMWYNRCTQHYAVADYLPDYRRMERVTVRGSRP
jgi:taurine dioxygenase